MTRLQDPAMQSISSQGVFVIGCARSGTTLLNFILNSGEDVYVLGESNLCFHWEKTHFVEWFNKMHAASHALPHRTVFLPPSSDPAAAGADVFHSLADRFRYVGEKTAFGPHGVHWEGMDHFDNCLDFYGKRFPTSRYFLVLRDPVENVWSMHKKFPDKPVLQLLDCWVRSFAFAVRCYFCFPRSLVLFHHRMDGNVVDRLGAILGTRLGYDPRWILPADRRKSHLGQDDFPERLKPYEWQLSEMRNLFHILESTFSATTWAYSGELPPDAFLEYSLAPKLSEVEELFRGVKEG